MKHPSEYFPIEKTKVLVVGTFHLDYPGLDVNKTADEDKIDVLVEPKKSELTEVVEYIKKFKPTKIAIEALDMETPAAIHSFSTRPFPERTPHFDYDPNYKVLKVTQNGAIRWKSYYWVCLTAALKGKYVGIEELGKGIWKVFYRNVFLGFFNENELRNKEKSIRLETNLV